MLWVSGGRRNSKKNVFLWFPRIRSSILSPRFRSTILSPRVRFRGAAPHNPFLEVRPFAGIEGKSVIFRSTFFFVAPESVPGYCPPESAFGGLVFWN